MKKILLPFFIFCSLNCFSQANIILDTVGNACHVDKIGFAKDNMTYTLNGDSAVNIIIVGSEVSYKNANYKRFRSPDGSSYPTRQSLTDWMDLYFFASALADSSSAIGGMWQGGQSMFTADGVTTIFNITTNLGATPSYFTLTTTTPITLNQLNRTITFPDLNTMRVEFNTPPLLGEDVNYVWIVYK